MQAAHKLFFALVPDPATTVAIERATTALKAAAPGRARWVRPERWHVTLDFVGSFPEQPEASIVQAVQAAAAVRGAPFEFVLDHADSFPGRTPPWVLRSGDVPVAMTALARDLHHALPSRARGAGRRLAFAPHLTVAYGRERLPARITVPSVHWKATSFVVMHSASGASAHRTVASWKLGE